MKKNIFLILPIVILWFFLFPIYRNRVPAFGCFDDCFNFMGGYFLNAGKRLFSGIFFNHQPLMAYLSAVIQKFIQPQTIYALVLAHREFVIFWAMLWDSILVLRFGWVGLGFIFLYEITKGFVFGERFLAEALIIYPIVYLVGLIGKKQSLFDRIVVGISVWFVVFSREPYVPLALLFLMLLGTRTSFVLFLALSLLTLAPLPLRDYFFNVVTVNTMLAKSGNIAASVLYPIAVFFGGTWNLFRFIEIGLTVLFWLSVPKKTIWLPIIILALANIRPITPGTIYYQAFQHLVGYGVLLMLVLTNLKNFLWLGFIALALFAVLSPSSYLYDRVDRSAEFTQNYGQYFVPGEVVRLLSNPTDTLFLDGYDDLIYWQAKRLSPYSYGWYTSVMPQFALYTEARTKMFLATPPDFYYGRCEGVEITSLLPDAVINEYARFFWQDRPTCLFVRRQKLESIPKDRLAEVNRQFEYSVR